MGVKTEQKHFTVYKMYFYVGVFMFIFLVINPPINNTQKKPKVLLRM